MSEKSNEPEIPTNYYEYTYSKSRADRVIFDINSSTIYIDGVCITSKVGDGHTVYLTSDGTEYCLHREDGPAYIEEYIGVTRSYFHINGYNYKIEDLPVDDEMKLYLKLMHDGYTEGHAYHYYTVGGIDITHVPL